MNWNVQNLIWIQIYVHNFFSICLLQGVGPRGQGKQEEEVGKLEEHQQRANCSQGISD